MWRRVLVAAVRDLAPCLRIPNAQLARHVESLSARSGSVNSEALKRVTPEIGRGAVRVVGLTAKAGRSEGEGASDQ